MKILLIGDQCIDRFIYGETKRLSPEAPVPVLTPQDRIETLGMAGNVLRNLNSLAPEIEVVNLFPEEPSIKTRYVDSHSNYHLVRVDEDQISPPLLEETFDKVFNKNGPFDAVIMSDYAKGFLTMGNMKYIASACRRRNIPTFCDTKYLLGEWSKDIYLIKINQKEYTTQINAGIVAPWKLCQNLVLTKGKDGSVMITNSGEIKASAKSEVAKVFDVVGAGDVVLAALAIAHIKGKDSQESLDFANRAAAFAVSQPGVTAVKMEDIVK